MTEVFFELLVSYKVTYTPRKESSLRRGTVLLTDGPVVIDT